MALLIALRYFIQIYRVPEGDGNQAVKILLKHIVGIQIYRVPEGDGNTYRRCLPASGHYLDIQSPRRGRKHCTCYHSFPHVHLDIQSPRRGRKLHLMLYVNLLRNLDIQSPRRGRKPYKMPYQPIALIQIYRVPEGDGNWRLTVLIGARFLIQIYRVPEGDGNFCDCYAISCHLFIQIYRVPEGDGNRPIAQDNAFSVLFRYIESPKGTETCVLISTETSYRGQFRYIESPKGTETLTLGFHSTDAF